jgi:uncharacterized membrane protein YccF (DUF307 family)
MPDTPSKPFPAIKPNPTVWARIDPEGNVSATWRTWCILAGAIVWATVTYTELRGAAKKVDAIAIEVQAHREILIKAGLLPVGASVVKVSE